MKPSEILNAALELMSEGWCKYAAARDRDGYWCSLSSPEAAAWCAFGALNRIERHTEEDHREAFFYVDRAAESLGFAAATIANDNGTALDVGRMFCRAIQLAEADGR